MNKIRVARPVAFISGCAILAAIGSATPAAVVRTNSGTGADAYVSNDSQFGPTVANGLKTTVDVRAVTDSRARVSLLRFDLSSLSGDLTGATLTLDFASANRARTWNIYGLNDSIAAEAWNESSITYNTAPGFLPATLGNYALDIGANPGQLTLLGTFAAPTAAGVVTSSAASLNLDNFLTADTNDSVTLVLAFPSGTDTNPTWAVQSKETTSLTATIPTLTIPNAVEVPEPAGSLLLGLGAMGLLRRRR